MSFSNKIDSRTIGLILISLVGGVIGGILVDTTNRSYEIESLSNAFITQLDTKDNEISVLEEQVLELENAVADLMEPTIVGFSSPDYDSGWIPIGLEETVPVHHNLDSYDLFVYLIGSSGPGSLHQKNIGTDVYFTMYNDEHDNLVFEANRLGAFWRASSSNVINVQRQTHDYSWEQFRLLIWMLPEPPEGNELQALQ